MCVHYTRQTEIVECFKGGMFLFFVTNARTIFQIEMLVIAGRILTNLLIDKYLEFWRTSCSYNWVYTAVSFDILIGRYSIWKPESTSKISLTRQCSCYLYSHNVKAAVQSALDMIWILTLNVRTYQETGICQVLFKFTWPKNAASLRDPVMFA